MMPDLGDVMGIIAQIDGAIDDIAADLAEFDTIYGNTAPDDHPEGYRFVLSAHNKLVKRHALLRQMIGLIRLLFTKDEVCTKSQIGDARYAVLTGKIQDWALRLLDLETQLTSKRGWNDA